MNLAEHPLTTARDARQASRLIARYAEDPDRHDRGSDLPSLFHMIVSLFQNAITDEAATVLEEQALGHLVRLYDQRLAALDADPPALASWDSRHDDLLFALKIFAMYGHPPGLDRIRQAALRPLDPDGFLWLAVFGQLAMTLVARRRAGPTPDHPLDPFVGVAPEALQGVIQLAYLDLANHRAHDGWLVNHPFDTPAGHALLAGWLGDPDPDRSSYAHCAAASVPYLGVKVQPRLLALAAVHPSPQVQMEGAWAQAAIGDEDGVGRLAALAADPRYCEQACSYLDDLERTDAIPDVARDLDFRALAAMYEWLSLPAEFGRPPDDIQAIDSRELDWPPTGDRRRMWLFHYRYGRPGSAVEGVGIVGSETFALPGPSTLGKSPEDLYALYCCWELQEAGDPRAPRTLSVAAGRRLLGWPAGPAGKTGR